MVIILLMLLPVAAVLIVWSAFDNIRFDFSFAVQDSKVYTLQCNMSQYSWTLLNTQGSYILFLD